MARGKIQIKRIENATNRQVTYSKRRNGLFKKASELSVLCDAKVSIIMFSTTNKLHEFITPSITTKALFDQYQKTLGIDLWKTHYEKMQENLKQLKEVNRRLKTEISQRFGECLNNLGIKELHDLEDDMENSVKIIRERKYKVLSNQIDTGKKKLRNAQEIHRKLMHEFDYGLVDDGVDYDSMIGARIYGLHLQHSGAASASDLTTFPLLE